MNKLIALDADGVLLDYNLAYGRVWERAFGQTPQLVEPRAYWARHRWGIPELAGDELAHFRSHFDTEFWSSVPAIDGALEACLALHGAGYKLVVVSALPPEYQQDRLANLLSHGFPIADVFSTPGAGGLDTVSPKAETLRRLKPVAFVDDYLPYLRGLTRDSMHVALITRDEEGSPNHGPEMTLADSTHGDLRDFADWWLSGAPS